ncbi:hypothetical protein Ancab_038640 [Ancistrocladus abbreviatus]
MKLRRQTGRKLEPGGSRGGYRSVSERQRATRRATDHKPPIADLRSMDSRTNTVRRSYADVLKNRVDSEGRKSGHPNYDAAQKTQPSLVFKVPEDQFKWLKKRYSAPIRSAGLPEVNTGLELGDNSISDSNIQNMNRLFLLHESQVRAEEVWAIGQALGASFEGDEQELLLRIDDMEARDRAVWENKKKDEKEGDQGLAGINLHP